MKKESATVAQDHKKENHFWKELPKKALTVGLLLFAGAVVGNWIGGPVEKAKSAAGL